MKMNTLTQRRPHTTQPAAVCEKELGASIAKEKTVSQHPEPQSQEPKASGPFSRIRSSD